MTQQHPTNFRFSHKAIENLPIPKYKPAEYSDQIVVGLRIYVGISGAKRWRFRFRYDGKPCVMVLGKFPSMSLEKARDLAREKELLITDGIDPKLEKIKRQSCPTFKTFTEEVFIPYAIRERKGIKDILNRIDNKLMPQFGNMKLINIRREHVVAMVELLAADISGVTANRTRSLLSSIMEKAIDYGHIELNPTRQIRKCQENGPRTVHLKDEEAARFHAELTKEVERHNPSAEALCLLFLTGLRKSETYGLTWKQVDLDKATIFIPFPKNGIPKTIPMNSLALKLVKDIHRYRGAHSRFLFPGSGKSGHIRETRKTFRMIKELSGVNDLRPHDLRRSFATILYNQGESLSTIGKLLGHEDLRTTEKVYAHLQSDTLRTTSERFVEKLISLAP